MELSVTLVTDCCKTAYQLKDEGRQMCKCGNFFSLFIRKAKKK